MQLLNILRQKLYALGYSHDDIDESLYVSVWHDNLKLEFDYGHVLIRIFDSLIRTWGISPLDGKLLRKKIKPENLDTLCQVTKELVNCNNPRIIRRITEAAIRYIASEEYWKFARIGTILDRIIAKSTIIPPELIQSVLEEMREETWERNYVYMRKYTE